MSGMGPCSEEGSACSLPFLSCYRDCCERGVQFCNHRERRCQRCEIREALCGSVRVPWECDAYCLRQEILRNSTASSNLVDEGYKHATIGLGVIVAILVAAHVGSYCRKQRQEQKTDNINEEKDKISLTLSTDGTGASCEDDKGGQKGGAENIERSPSDATLTTTKTIESLSPPPDPNFLRMGDGARLPARETMQVLGQRPFGDPDNHPSDCSNSQTAVPEEEQSLMSHPAERVPTCTPTQPAEQKCCPGICRDSRLDNIPPTSDTDRDVYTIHTG